MKRFYTYPDFSRAFWRRHGWPHVIVSFGERKRLTRYPFRHAILDAGVEVFAKGTEDYPPKFLENYAYEARLYTRLVGEDRLWVTVPDYPGDYAPVRNRPDWDNVERTLRNVERFISVGGVNWLPVIQGRWMDLESFERCARELRRLVGGFPRVAIGTVCKSRQHGFIVKCCQVARRYFPRAWIHAFGPTLDAVPKMLPYIDSWDSCAWYTSRRAGQRMCKTKEERKRYYLEYISRVERILAEHAKQLRLTEAV